MLFKLHITLWNYVRSGNKIEFRYIPSHFIAGKCEIKVRERKASATNTDVLRSPLQVVGGYTNICQVFPLFIYLTWVEGLCVDGTLYVFLRENERNGRQVIHSHYNWRKIIFTIAQAISEMTKTFINTLRILKSIIKKSFSASICIIINSGIRFKFAIWTLFYYC